MSKTDCGIVGSIELGYRCVEDTTPINESKIRMFTNAILSELYTSYQRSGNARLSNRSAMFLANRVKLSQADITRTINNFLIPIGFIEEHDLDTFNKPWYSIAPLGIAYAKGEITLRDRMAEIYLERRPSIDLCIEDHLSSNGALPISKDDIIKVARTKSTPTYKSLRTSMKNNPELTSELIDYAYASFSRSRFRFPFIADPILTEEDNYRFKIIQDNSRTWNSESIKNPFRGFRCPIYSILDPKKIQRMHIEFSIQRRTSYGHHDIVTFILF